MPFYDYRREDGSVFEFRQSIHDDALTVCPTTGQPCVRIITSPAGVQFKGRGFYETDYKPKKSDPS